MTALASPHIRVRVRIRWRVRMAVAVPVCIEPRCDMDDGVTCSPRISNAMRSIEQT